MLKRVGDLKPGDVILGPDGEEVTVTEVFEEHLPVKMYELELEDSIRGTVTVQVSGNHLFYVESTFDISYHQERRAQGKKLLKNLTPLQLEEIRLIATATEEIDTTILDMVGLCEFDDSREGVNLIQRIADSLGPIAEDVATTIDYETGEEIHKTESVANFDARQFCQQVLSLHGNRKDKKRWPLIVGRVLTTEQMLALGDLARIPTMRSVAPLAE